VIYSYPFSITGEQAKEGLHLGLSFGHYSFYSCPCHLAGIITIIISGFQESITQELLPSIISLLVILIAFIFSFGE
jgi:hypothetical protein